MLETIPTHAEMTTLLGEELCNVWEELCKTIEKAYDMDQLWDKGYREWIYEYKYRRGGKTLCTLYVKEGTFGLQIIFGKDERAKVEAIRNELSEEVWQIYENAHTYHDGKWVMFYPTDTAMFEDFMKLLGLKRRPNRK